MTHADQHLLPVQSNKRLTSRIFYPLDKPYDESARQAFFAELNNPQFDPDKCYFTRWDFDTNQVVSVYGNIPSTYDETMEESEESEDPE